MNGPLAFLTLIALGVYEYVVDKVNRLLGR